MSHEHSPDDDDLELIAPFWIDTEAYSDRDRLMFCCGCEFQMVREELETGEPIERTIHAENESRLRMLCGHVGRKATTKSLDIQWSLLVVEGPC